MHKHFPNFLTLLNLTAGCVGIVWALQGDLALAAVCLWLGAVLDFLDGLAARLLQASSPMGQQLDSLADMVTFGLLPAMIMYALMQQHGGGHLPYVALLMPAFSALRLAQFNAGPRQDTVFIGFPTLAQGVLISTLHWIIAANKYPGLTAWLAAPPVLAVIALATSALLVSPYRFMAFKLTTYAWYPNRWRYGFVCVAAVLLLSLQAEGLALSIILYGLMPSASQ